MLEASVRGFRGDWGATEAWRICLWGEPCGEEKVALRQSMGIKGDASCSKQ